MCRDRVLSKSVIAPSVRMSPVHPINDIHPSKNTHYVYVRMYQFWLDHKSQALIQVLHCKCSGKDLQLI